MQQLSILIPLLLVLVSCSSEPEKQEERSTVKGCINCHVMQLDPAHDFDCTECHNGNNEVNDKALGHAGLIAQPAHPDAMADSCGRCHDAIVNDASHSLHFTLRNEINLIRFAFGAQEELADLTEIPISESPETILALSDDLLRRRCLRCHVYSSGDRYPAIARGTGCASCHLEFYEGKLVSHSFVKSPKDQQCLQCHYGNFVGYDYHGRFEHDMNDEYRTPYTTRNDYFRPFGVEYHPLQADIHQVAGLVCIDCHFGTELMNREESTLDCASCHAEERLHAELPENIERKKDHYVLFSKGDQKEHRVVLMQHSAHEKHKNIAGCQVCHAQWSYNDNETHLLRSDMDEYDDFSRLTVQGSFEIEKMLINNLDFDAEELDPVMTDKISGESSPGLWHKGYLTRRWENVAIGRDKSGKLQVMRPILDLHLSWIDEDEEVHFDAVKPVNRQNGGMLPYIPHTTGKAGLFYEDRIRQFLRSEQESKQ